MPVKFEQNKAETPDTAQQGFARGRDIHRPSIFPLTQYFSEKGIEKKKKNNNTERIKFFLILRNFFNVLEVQKSLSNLFSVFLPPFVRLPKREEEKKNFFSSSSSSFSYVNWKKTFFYLRARSFGAKRVLITRDLKKRKERK